MWQPIQKSSHLNIYLAHGHVGQWFRLDSAEQFFWSWLGSLTGPTPAGCPLEPWGTLGHKSRILQLASLGLFSRRGHRYKYFQASAYCHVCYHPNCQNKSPGQAQSQAMEGNPTRWEREGPDKWHAHGRGEKDKWRFGPISTINPTLPSLILENRIAPYLSTKFLSMSMRYIFNF